MWKYACPQIAFNTPGDPPSNPNPNPNPAPPTPWHDGMDAELIGHAQTHGWSQLGEKDAVKAVLKAHYEAKKMMGVPPEQLIRLPKDMSDPAQLGPVYERLGHPKEAKEYDFAGLKRANGEEISEALATALRNAAWQHRVPKAAATDFAKTFIGHLDAQEAAALSEKTAKLAQERAELKADWQAAPEVNMLLARAAAERLGVTEAEVDALQNQIGYKRVMQMFRTIGEKLGEHSYLLPTNPGGSPRAMTREQAVVRMEELKGDVEWGKRWQAGGTPEKQEWESLQKIVAG
jgi:hypothetical protein